VGDGDQIAHFHVFGRACLGEEDEANERVASVGFFETLKASLTRGRYFTEDDDSSRPHVAIINQTMALQAFGGDDPIGNVSWISTTPILHLKS
jgi:macrolide transport system ATP-binding/permease protein